MEEIEVSYCTVVFMAALSISLLSSRPRTRSVTAFINIEGYFENSGTI